MTAVKRCPRCWQVKAAAEFYRRRGGRQLSSYCQRCTQAASNEARNRRRQDPASAEVLRGAGSGPPAPPPGSAPPGR